jgi:uncharacterized membrane protein
MTIRGKWAISLLVLLGISLSMNLFVAGFAVSRFHGMGRGGGGGVDHMIGAFVNRFPREIRHNLRVQLDEVRPELSREFMELGDARQRMFALMREEQLDMAALEETMVEARQKLTDAMALGQRAVLRAIENADPATRASIGEGRGGWWHRRQH